MADTSEPFYLALPSNSSSDHYSNNKPQAFKVRLPRTLVLRGKWEVALVEMYAPGTYVNIMENAKFQIGLSKGDQATKTLTRFIFIFDLPSAYYNSVETVCTRLNELAFEAFRRQYEINRVRDWGVVRELVRFTFNKVTDLIDVSNMVEDTLRVSITVEDTPTMQQLGFLNTAIEEIQQTHYTPFTTFHRATLTKQFPAIFVYCDIIENQMVGDTFAPLLRTIPIRTLESEIISESFIRPYYLKVRNEYISEIEVRICTDTGDLVQFLSGKSNLLLHFRRVSL